MRRSYQHSELKTRQSLVGEPTIWYDLPEQEIVKRLLTTRASVHGISRQYGCSETTIKKIYRWHTTPEQRAEARIIKKSMKGKTS